MRKLVVPAIGVVLVAGALWFWLGRSKTAETTTSQSTAKPVEQPRVPVERNDRTGDLSGLQVRIDDDPAGDLRLEGQVVDSDDHPVGGATVVLGSNPPRVATTEADGGFAFTALVGRPYTLVARADKGIAGPVTARLTKASDPVILHLKPAAKVTVTVTGTDAQPIENATVELRGIDHQRQTTTAKGTTTFATVVPGGYQVAAYTDKLAHSMTWIQVGAGETQAKLVLAPGSPVAGKVVDDKGAPVVGAH